MKRYFLIMIFIVMPTCKAMEKETNNITELTSIYKPHAAQYLTNNRIIIVSEEKLYSNIVVQIINTENNNVIKTVFEGDPREYGYRIHLAVHPNKQKFALSSRQQVTIYNSETGQKEWCSYIRHKRYIDTATFSPIENTIFITYYGKNKTTLIERCNYSTDAEDIIYDGDMLRHDIALHPTQPIMYAGNSKGKLFFFSSKTQEEQGFSTWNSSMLPKIIETGYTSHDYQYNHDGSIVIAHGSSTIYIAAPAIINHPNHHPSGLFNNPKFQKLCNFLNLSAQRPYNPVLMSPSFKDDTEKENYCPIEKVIFYPQSLLLTILLHTKHPDRSAFDIKYWDIQTQQCIQTTPILQTERHYSTEPVGLSFSPDCTNLLVVCEDKCLVVPVPLEVQNRTREYVQSNDPICNNSNESQ